MLLGGSSAVIYSIIGEPFGFAASYLGWIIGLPTLVIVSLLSDHSPEENPDLFI
jgi:SSS family solute:Na+ symporter